MTLPSSFPISVSQINVELGRNAGDPFDIQGTAERNLAEVPSGAISFSDFLGKSTAPIFQANYGPITGQVNPSFTNVSFGAAGANRVIIVAVHWNATTVGISSQGFNSATIGGVAATIHVNRVDNWGGGGGGGGGHPAGGGGPGDQNYMGLAIISAAVAAGTTGTVALSFQNSVNSYIGVWRSPNTLNNITTAGAVASPGASISTSITVPSNGKMIVAATTQPQNSVTVTPGTQNYDNAWNSVWRAGGSVFVGSGSQTIQANTGINATEIELGALAWN